MNEKKMAKALPIDVYRHQGQDCTANGISSRYDTLYLICDDGFIDIDLNDAPENTVCVVTKIFENKKYKYIAPIDYRDHWYMAGGNIAYCCDSRFTELSQYPLNIHDRREW